MIGYLGYFKVFSNILGYFKVFLDNWDFLGYLDIFRGYWDYQLLRGVLGYSKIFGVFSSIFEHL